MAAVTPPPVDEGLTDPLQRRFRGSAKISEYEVMKEKLGEGTFGVVSKAKSRRTGSVVALKKILMHNEKEGFPITALREVKLLKMLSHPNILRLEEMAVERQQGNDKGKSGKKRAVLYMVTPYMDHDLSGMLTNPDIVFSEAQVKCYMLQLLEGLRYLHDSNILHRDMKAANILISNKGILQIADFGLARHYEGQTPLPGRGNGDAVRDYTSLVVTRWYRPPELLLTLKRYTPAIDMWGIGCVFGEMFEGKPILEGRSDVDQCHKIFTLIGNPNEQTMPGWSDLPGCEGHKDWEQSRGDIDKRFGRQTSPQGLDLLKKLLCLDWRTRINAIDALQHPYFKTAPLPSRPEDIPWYNDSHELDARRRGNQEKQRALPPAPQGGTVGNPDEPGYPINGAPSYRNGFGYGDRSRPAYGRDRGPPGVPPPRGYDDWRGAPRDRRGPPPPGLSYDDRRPPQDRRPPPPSNGHQLPARPPVVELPSLPRPDAPQRSVPPPVGANRGGPNVDTYIPPYYGGGQNYDRPTPRDSYDRGRRGSRENTYRDADVPRGSRENSHREPDARGYRDSDAHPSRQYRDADAPNGRPGSRGDDSFRGGDSYRDRDRDRGGYSRDDTRRTRSRSPDRDRDRERRERLQDRERDFYRR